MKKMLLGILTVSLFSSFANAGDDPYAVGSILPENPIKVDKNVEKLPAPNAVWKKYHVDYAGAVSYVDVNSLKIADNSHQIYEVDIKTTYPNNGGTQYIRNLLGCGAKNYIGPINGYVNKKFDHRGSLSFYTASDYKSSLRYIHTFNDSYKNFVALKAAACK